MSKNFGGVPALRNVTLEVGEKEILGLIGPNGSGKSTLLNVISGLVRADGGRVLFSGRDVTGVNPETLCRLGVSRTFQAIRPFASLTSIQNVEIAHHFGRSNKGGPSTDPTEYLQMVGLSQKGNVQVRRLSLVERRLLELTMALASEPKLMLLDEILAGLDEYNVGIMTGMIHKFAEDRSVIFVEHKMREVRTLCDRIVVLSQGEKIFEGTPHEAFTDVGVVQAYLGEKLES